MGIGCPPGETARLALLRREIEKLASTEEGKAECFEKAPAAGVPPQRLMMAEAGKLTNIVDVIMEAAELEVLQAKSREISWVLTDIDEESEEEGIDFDNPIALSEDEDEEQDDAMFNTEPQSKKEKKAADKAAKEEAKKKKRRGKNKKKKKKKKTQEV